ncbi:hypothetical protein [Stutzerimonas kunmingensis]|uniref:hypothetical protein n=1 Tax=Stutzerimonas kunmingensis TaxID=1211807 RepID=UPI000CB1E870|nr:hypothetical protein [Stutzerimonas kunmingensis]MCQ2034431.1 hypothetical protein [Stutzerimonas kunmingensis]PKM14120.1 MAG: hypothetical protein CVV15_00440 [Gammaproteobacteria bacterium HGW-Gammaproteobacteria-5]
MNSRIEVLALQIMALCMRISAAGNYTAHCEYDADNHCIACRVRKPMAKAARITATPEEQSARHLFSEYIYIDAFTESLDLDEAQAQPVCTELEALIEKLIAYARVESEVPA